MEELILSDPRICKNCKDCKIITHNDYQKSVNKYSLECGKNFDFVSSFSNKNLNCIFNIPVDCNFYLEHVLKNNIIKIKEFDDLYPFQLYTILIVDDEKYLVLKDVLIKKAKELSLELQKENFTLD